MSAVDDLSAGPREQALRHRLDRALSTTLAVLRVPAAALFLADRRGRQRLFAVSGGAERPLAGSMVDARRTLHARLTPYGSAPRAQWFDADRAWTGGPLPADLAAMLCTPVLIPSGATVTLAVGELVTYSATRRSWTEQDRRRATVWAAMLGSLLVTHLER